MMVSSNINYESFDRGCDDARHWVSVGCPELAPEEWEFGMGTAYDEGWTMVTNMVFMFNLTHLMMVGW